MNRRDFLKITSMNVLPMIVGGCVFNGTQESGRPPNIILIMADDLGYGDLGCYGGVHSKTPHIDALADGGMKFTDFHSNGAVCSPTRAALMTGCYQQRSGISGVVTAAKHRDTGLDLKETTFAEALKRSGYATALFGKWHLGYQTGFNPCKQGFDEFKGFVSGNIDYRSHIDQEGYEDWWQGNVLKPEEGYTTHLIARHGLRFLEKNRARPFCMLLAHEAPHYPFQGPDDPAYRKPGMGKPPGGIREDKQNAYREMIESMDRTVGQIVEKVKQLGLENNTLIFFCSDNGGARNDSNGGLRGTKGTLWEGGHRVPGIAYWPGRIPRGTITHETAMTMDLFPTMMELAGTTVTHGTMLDGVSLEPVMLHNQPLPERTLFWQHGNRRAVRKGAWKLVVIKNKTEKTHLFNLIEDPFEKNNLAESAIEKVNELNMELNRWEDKVSSGIEQRT